MASFQSLRVIRLLILLFVVLVVVHWMIYFFQFLITDWTENHLMQLPINALESTAPTSAAMIPRIIHQTFGGDRTLPEAWDRARKSCLDRHQDWQYMFWTDESARAFLSEEFPDALANYDAYPYAIQRVDAIRYYILFKYGGFYLDMDVGCRKEMEPLRRYPAIFPQTQPLGVSNDFMASTTGHPFFRRLIDKLPAFNHRYGSKYPTVMISTGPIFVDSQLFEYAKSTGNSINSTFVVMPSELYGGHKESFFYHVPGSSWHGSDTVVIMQIYQSPIISASIAFGSLILIWRCIKRRRGSKF
eukprot:Partr_v1_DN27766_c1_g1_i4_m67246 putative Mannosyl phosphorylinositol ceramide synthase SUR1